MRSKRVSSRAGSGSADVEVHLSPVLDLLSHSLGGERRVASVVEAALRAAGGSWRATLTPSAALEHFWVVRLVRPGGRGPTRSVVFDERSPGPDGQLCQAILDIMASDAPSGFGAAARSGEGAEP